MRQTEVKDLVDEGIDEGLTGAQHILEGLEFNRDRELIVE